MEEFIYSRSLDQAKGNVYHKILDYMFKICNVGKLSLENISSTNSYANKNISFSPITSNVFKSGFEDVYGMNVFTIYFYLTDEVKNFLKKSKKFDCYFYNETNEYGTYFGNIAFLQDSSPIITTLTHEGILDVKAEYAKVFDKIYYKEIKKEYAYKILKENFKKFSVEEKTYFLDRGYKLLSNLYTYMQYEKNTKRLLEGSINIAIDSSLSEDDKISFKEYQTLIHSIMPRALCKQFDKLHSFSEIENNLLNKIQSNLILLDDIFHQLKIKLKPNCDGYSISIRTIDEKLKK